MKQPCKAKKKGNQSRSEYKVLKKKVKNQSRANKDQRVIRSEKEAMTSRQSKSKSRTKKHAHNNLELLEEVENVLHDKLKEKLQAMS